jgi:hypothetical protein
MNLAAGEVRLAGFLLAFLGTSMYMLNQRYALPFVGHVLDLVPSSQPRGGYSPRLHWDQGPVPETEVWHKISSMP